MSMKSKKNLSTWWTRFSRLESFKWGVVYLSILERIKVGDLWKYYLMLTWHYKLFCWHLLVYLQQKCENIKLQNYKVLQLFGWLRLEINVLWIWLFDLELFATGSYKVNFNITAKYFYNSSRHVYIERSVLSYVTS